MTGRVALVAVVVIVAVAGYATGRHAGSDLDAARAAGARTGRRVGSGRGARAGYRVGLAQSRQSGFAHEFRGAYLRAFRHEFRGTGLAQPHTVRVPAVTEHDA